MKWKMKRESLSPPFMKPYLILAQALSHRTQSHIQTELFFEIGPLAMAPAARIFTQQQARGDICMRELPGFSAWEFLF